MQIWTHALNRRTQIIILPRLLAIRISSWCSSNNSKWLWPTIYTMKVIDHLKTWCQIRTMMVTTITRDSCNKDVVVKTINKISNITQWLSLKRVSQRAVWAYHHAQTHPGNRIQFKRTITNRAVHQSSSSNNSICLSKSSRTRTWQLFNLYRCREDSLSN